MNSTGGHYEFKMVPLNSTVVTSNASAITLSPGQNATVVYTIKTNSSEGYYYLNIPFLCPSVPLSVGYTVPDVQVSDFPGSGPVPCPAFALRATMTEIDAWGSYRMGY